MQVGEEVIWYEGMLIVPQHLQASATLQQATLTQHLQALGAPQMGVFDLEWDQSHLNRGILTLAAANVIMPSGRALRWSSKKLHKAPSLDLSCWRSHPPQRTRVFLVVPHLNDSGPNVIGLQQPSSQGPQEQADARFCVAARQVRDWTEPTEQAHTILFAQPRVRLMVEEELDARFESLPVGMVEHTAEGTLRLDAAFTPPCLRMAAAPSVSAALARLADNVQQLAYRLASRRPASPHAGDALQRSLFAALPLVADAAYDGEATPKQSYSLLRQAAGLLAPWVSAETAACLGRTHFDASRLDTSLQPLMAIVAEAARSLPPQTCHRQPFLRPTHGPLTVSLANVAHPHASRWYLAVANIDGAFANEAERWLRLCKLAAASWLGRHIQAALPAVGMSVVPSPPAELELDAGTLLFAIDTAHPSWLAGLKERALGLAVPREPALPGHAELTLLGLAET